MRLFYTLSTKSYPQHNVVEITRELQCRLDPTADLTAILCHKGILYYLMSTLETDYWNWQLCPTGDSDFQ